jgi:hypothetical protein
MITLSEKLQTIAKTKAAEIAACGRELATNFNIPCRDIIAMHTGLTPQQYHAIRQWLIETQEKGRDSLEINDQELKKVPGAGC